ncbi:hypothetical protein NX025_20640 [Vibrio vulnificus]|nr:hypothetical protein [Vibrio vulnificus]
MVKLSCGNFCIACRRPLTRRYVLVYQVDFESAIIAIN